MKKNIIKLVYMLLAFVMVTSCEWDPIMFDSSKSFVAFQSVATTIPEQGGQVGVVVKVTALLDAPSVTVNYEFDTSGIDQAVAAFEGTHFTLINSEKILSFSEGWGFDTIWIQPVDNDVFTGDMKFNIKLTSNSEDYQFGEADLHTITLADNEHPLGQWIGTYTVAAASYGDPGNWDEVWSVSTSANPDNVNKLMITITKDGIGAPFAADIDLEAMTIVIPSGTDAGSIYGYGPTIMYVGDFATLDQSSPITGTIEEDGTIRIDLLAMYLSDHDYYWDAFNTVWTKTGKKSVLENKVNAEKYSRLSNK